jgi:hypothetical protein
MPRCADKFASQLTGPPEGPDGISLDLESHTPPALALPTEELVEAALAPMRLHHAAERHATEIVDTARVQALELVGRARAEVAALRDAADRQAQRAEPAADADPDALPAEPAADADLDERAVRLVLEPVESVGEALRIEQAFAAAAGVERVLLRRYADGVAELEVIAQQIPVLLHEILRRPLDVRRDGDRLVVALGPACQA